MEERSAARGGRRLPVDVSAACHSGAALLLLIERLQIGDQLRQGSGQLPDDFAHLLRVQLALLPVAADAECGLTEGSERGLLVLPEDVLSPALLVALAVPADTGAVNRVGIRPLLLLLSLQQVDDLRDHRKNLANHFVDVLRRQLTLSAKAAQALVRATARRRVRADLVVSKTFRHF